MFMGLLQHLMLRQSVRTSLEDKARSGRPLDATDEEICKKVRDLVYSDRRIQMEDHRHRNFGEFRKLSTF